MTDRIRGCLSLGKVGLVLTLTCVLWIPYLQLAVGELVARQVSCAWFGFTYIVLH